MSKQEHTTLVSGVGSRISGGRWKAPTALGVAVVVVAAAGWFGLHESGVLSGGPGSADGYVATPVNDDAAAHAIPGTYSADRKTWTSAANLRVADTYQLSAETSAPSVNGVGLQHETFSTANEENNIKFDDMYPIDGSTVGVGQPVVLEFEHPVPKADRAGVERALAVYSTPQQSGSCGWLSSQR